MARLFIDVSLGVLRPILILVAIGLSAPASGETIVEGCGVAAKTEGTISITTMSSSNPTARVNIYNSSSPLQIISLDVRFPAHLVTPLTASRGGLTRSWQFFEYAIESNHVSIAAFATGGDRVPPGAIGTLFEIEFAIDNPGVGEFYLQGYEGTENYTLCPVITSASDSVVPSSLARVKALYRGTNRIR